MGKTEQKMFMFVFLLFRKWRHPRLHDYSAAFEGLACMFEFPGICQSLNWVGKAQLNL